MAKKHVGTVTAALQPMFSPFEKWNRKKLKICDPKNIRWIGPPVAAKEIFTILKAS